MNSYQDPGFYRGIPAEPLSLDQYGPYGNLIFDILILFLAILAIIGIVNLWKRKIEIKRKLKWALILLIPLFGILVYSYSFTGSKK